jgi:hypothetical protein
MTRGEAEALLGVMKGAWDMYLDEYGVTAWTEFLKEQDVDLAAAAYVKLRDSQRDRPTIADLRKMIVKIEVDRKMAQPAIEEAPYVREVPSWVKAWIVARYRHRDFRVLPEQKPGYDTLQTSEPHFRTYVWPDQEPMPAEQAAVYAAEGAGLSVEDVFHTLTT